MIDDFKLQKNNKLRSSTVLKRLEKGEGFFSAIFNKNYEQKVSVATTKYCYSATTLRALYDATLLRK